MSTKRSASSAFGSLSVYTYQNPLAALFFPCTEGSNRSLVEPVLAAVFGPPCTSMFSLTSSSDGDFILADHAACGERLRLPQAAGAAGGSGEWRCLYIHEASFERGGAEISGALSLLCERLAAAEVAVLNMCSLARNFMVVRSSCEARAMQTLREAYEDGERPARPALPPPSGVRLRLLQPPVAICSLSREDVNACAHALLHLLFWQADAAGGEGGRQSERPRPSFLHYFEMGGEASLMVEEAALERLGAAHPTSWDALRERAEPTLHRGWRVLSVSADAGSDARGILAAVCLPLAGVPLMNVSTIDATFVLLPSSHLDTALSLLAPCFDVENEARLPRE